MMLGTLMQVIDTSIVNVAIPTMMGNLGATLDQIGWVSTGYIIANVIVLPLTGWLSSNFGRRKYLAASMIIFTAASFFCGTSRTLAMLVFWRVVQGAGGAALLSTAQATLMEVFPPWQQGMVQAVFGIGVMVGPTVGPTLGGWITDNYSWPWIFFINLPIGILAAILTILFMHDSRYQQGPNGRADVVGIGFLAVGLGSLQYMLEEGNRNDWLESAIIQWAIVAAVVCLTAFVLWELHTPNPAVDLRVLRNRGLAAGTVFATVIGVGLFGGIFILPVFLQQLRGFTANQTGWILFPGAMATAIMMPITGKLVSRVSPRILAGIGAGIFIISMLMMRDITMDTGPAELFWPLVLRGAAMGFIWMPLTLATLLGIKGRDLAHGAALFNLSRQLGGSAGIAFLSTFLDHRVAFHRSMLVEHISVYSGATMTRLHEYAAGMVAQGMPTAVAHKQAVALLDQSVNAQASVISFGDAFVMVAYIFIAALPLLLLFKKGLPGASAPAPVGE